MKLSSFDSAVLLPAAEDFTRNGDAGSGAVASFDLLCLPGIVMSFLDDSTFTESSGDGCAAKQLCFVVSGSHHEPEFTSSGTADSSALGAGPGREQLQPGGCASQFKFPCRDAVDADIAALMLLLGNFVMLLLQPDLSHAQEAEITQGTETE